MNKVTIRSLRTPTLSNCNLRVNKVHQLASDHALKIYKSNSIYTFIPKNACSTMRYSLALENGMIKGEDGIDWIHKNNQIFSTNLESLVLANYTFVILRCPYARLVSAFLDKVVTQKSKILKIPELMENPAKMEAISFTYFVKKLKINRLLNQNVHWRSQTDFLIYDTYDDYFCLEEFDKAETTLKNKIDFNVFDARKLTNHGTDQLNIESTISNSFKLKLKELEELKSQGIIPDPKGFYNDEIKSSVDTIYKHDIVFYKEKFGDKNIMFKN